MSLLIKGSDATKQNQEKIKDGDTGLWLDSDSLHDIKELLATLGGNVGTHAQLDRDTQSGIYTLTDAWQIIFEAPAIDAPQIIEIAYIGLENMAAGDQVELRVQNIKVSGGSYDDDATILFYESYLDARPANEKRIVIGRIVNQYGCKIEAKQALHPVSYKDIDIEIFQSGRIEIGGGGGTGSWTLSVDMPTGRRNLAVTAPVIGGKGYVIGGAVSGGMSVANERFDPLLGYWEGRTNITTPRDGTAQAVVSGVIYVLGGSTDTSKVVTNEAYDPDTDSWTAKADMPIGGYYGLAGTIAGKIYIVQKWIAAPTNVVRVYDPVGNSWDTKAVGTYGHQYVAGGEHNDLLYALGTISEVYDPDSNTWTTLAPKSETRSQFAGAKYHGIFYAFTGKNLTRDPYTDAYSPALNTWSKRADIPTPRSYDPTAFTISDKIYVAGGDRLGKTYAETNERFTPPD